MTVAHRLPDFDSQPPPAKRPLRPLHGIPEPERRTRAGLVASSLFHLLLLVGLLLPPFVGKLLEEPGTGAGGAGPAGGGGGGTGGTGGEITPERIRYMQVQSAPAAPPPQAVTSPTPTPVPPPPPEPEPEVVQRPDVAENAVAAPGTTIPTPGTGGGTGNDGSAGSGPGSGGGVGSGVGTGRGAGVGSGTGGGGDQVFPPTVTNLAILPIPVPARVRPYRLVAHFEVDERGNARLIEFNPSRDRAYNQKIREMLSEVRFRPAVRADDGRPVRANAVITAEAP